MWSKKNLLFATIVVAICFISSLILLKFKTPNYQGGFPAWVIPEVISSASVSIDHQVAGINPVKVNVGKNIEILIKYEMTENFSSWVPMLYEFDFRPKIDGHVDWARLRDPDLAYMTSDQKSEWKVHIAPGEYEFRLHAWTNDTADVTQPPQCWMLTEGSLIVEPR